ncbi:MAG: sensor histidine kinase, partial [Rhizobiaceae bacterium]
TLFAADIAVFMAVFLQWGFPERVPIEDLHFLGWLSIVSATTYMSWMALYYARMIAMRSELQVEAERYFQASAELHKAREISEKIGQERSLFFSKMSHELRTPLNAIIGYSELLLEDSEDAAKHDGQRSRDIGRINAAGKHLMSLVSDVLDNETLESDATNIQIQRFTIAELCDHVVASALPLIEKNGNKFTVDCPQPEDVLVTDRQKLQQMLINLLSNAAKFTKNGEVTMRLVVEDSLADDRLHAEVIDTGIGISQENMAKLFDQYIQADATISNRFGGTGIGLSIARKFSMLLGGSINVESRPERGSRFFIDIPANLKSAENSQKADAVIETGYDTIIDQQDRPEAA